jgi:hypothetical protein
MNGIRRYFLPVVAGASLVLAMTAVSPLVASAKGKTCTVSTGCGKIKASPKTVTASANGTTITVKGTGFTKSDTTVNILECQTGAVTENSCDLATVTPVTVSSKGTFTQSFSFLTNTYKDTNKDSCANTGKKPIKTCGVAAGNETMTDDAGPVAVSIKS